jgi:hypothetical protein
MKKHIHSQEEQHVEKILHHQQSPCDLDKTVDQPRRRTELWERDTNLS